MSAPSPAKGDQPMKRGWALPPRMHVIITFMIQFILLMILLGGVVPTLHTQGYSWALLIPAAAVVMVLLHYLVAKVGRWFPVRCRQCRAQSRYRGFGWWPFTYRYSCPECGTQMRWDVVGG